MRNVMEWERRVITITPGSSPWPSSGTVLKVPVLVTVWWPPPLRLALGHQVLEGVARIAGTKDHIPWARGPSKRSCRLKRQRGWSGKALKENTTLANVHEFPGHMPSSGGDKEVGEIGGLSEGGGHLKGSWQYGLERGEYLNFFCKNTVRLRNLRDYS
jgi:hypothetical protein